MNRVTLAGWLVAAMLVAALHSWPALGEEEYSGSFYYGNSSPCNGIIGPGDVTNVKLQVASGSGNYFGCQPNIYLVQDVDGDGSVAPADIGKIKMWVAGNMSTGNEGKAYTIEVLTPTFILPTGATCSDGPQLCVKLWDNPGLGDMISTPRPDWGVNFKVDPASECTTAILCGRDPTPTIGGGKNQFIQDTLVFQYTGLDGPATACVRVADPGGCAGKSITINTYVPDDLEALYQTGTIGRFLGLPPVTGAPITGIVPCGGSNLAVTPDPGAVNDGHTIQMTATAQCVGDVTLDPNTAWSVTSGNCSVGLHTGLVTAPEGCSAASCTIEAIYDPGGSPRSASATVAVTDDEAGNFTSLTAITCNNLNDPATPVGGVDCTIPDRISSDGCNRGPAACSWEFTGDVGAELCGIGTYIGWCTDGLVVRNDSAAVFDDEVGTWNSLTATTCAPVDDGSPISCSTPNRISSDGCNRGPAACAWSCPAGCSAGLNTTELCMPTLTAAYTGRCTDGAVNVADASTVNNNEQTATVNVTPEGPLNLVNGETVNFACSANYADACNRDCAGALSSPAGCGSLSGTLYTMAGAPCSELVSASLDGGNDGETVQSSCCLLTVTPDPVAINDGGTIRFTATDAIDGNVSQNVNTTWSVTAGFCTVNNVAPNKGVVTAPERCANYSCTIEAVYNPGVSRSDTATLNVTDNEAGTWDTLSPLACGPANDPVNVAAVCAPPNRISSADGCNRGPAICTWSCTGSCGELCMPVTGGAFNACCTDGAAQICDSNTVTNNETVPVTVTVIPVSTSISPGGTVNFYASATFADGCTLNVDGLAAWTKTANCTATLGATGLYTSTGGGCATGDTVTATYNTVAGRGRVSVGCCGTFITTVFPLQLAVGATVPQRNWSNAHVDQVITPVISNGATAGLPTSVTVNCINAGNSADVIPTTCNLSGLPGNLNVPCTPTVNFTQFSTYHCTATASGPGGSSSKSGHMYTAEAATPTDGGHAGGYVGGLNWNNTTRRCSDGTATITAIDADLNAFIPGKVYVQYTQGATVREYYTSAANGSVTVPVNCQPIDYLNLSYKCGKAHCDKVEEGATVGQWKAANTRNYRYMTFTNIDASQMTERMMRMGNAETGRWKSRVTGTISENYFANYIYARPASPYIRTILANPIHLRAGFTLSTLHGFQAVANGLDAMLLAPDYEVSVSICLLTRNNVGIPIAASLPPNLLLPELRRTIWSGSSACSNFTTNPGVYRFESWAYNPGVTENIWTLGAYMNASNFSLSGGLDLFGFPIYACGMGMYGVTTPANLVGDPINAIGANAGWRYDLREMWGAFTTLGYDPDAAVDRKILYSVYGRLPQDPARAGSTLWTGSYRLPQMTDSALGAGWDTRFYRKNVGIIAGADFGLANGVGITGLALNTLIDDPNFTLFMQGYLQSTIPKGGYRDVRMWANGAGTQTVSVQQAGVNSTWTAPSGTGISWLPVETGGPTNYSAISVISRGGLVDGHSSDPGPSAGGGFSLGSSYAPGSVVGVWHVGPAEGAGIQNISVNDFLNLPTTLAPLKDEYLYPAPQWANADNTGPINRNGELWRIRTAGAGDNIPKDSNNRYYFQFTRPSMTYATARTIHQWQVSLDETADFTGYGGTSSHQLVAKKSIKSRVMGTHGATSGTNIFQDVYARFQSQGVAAGDKLYINSRRNNVLGRRVTITAVTNQTTLIVADTWGSVGTLTSGAINVNYRVIRANRRGECVIDEYFGGGPGGYTCKGNAFWAATGPANSSNVRVLVPAVTQGAATLNGVTGFRPSFWEGLTNGNELNWTYSILVYNTGAATQGGLGGGWDWNNWDTRKEELTINHAAIDSARVIRQ